MTDQTDNCSFKQQTRLVISRLDHNSRIMRSVSDSFQKQLFTDVCLSCENQIINAHRLILASASTFFKSIFSTQPCCTGFKPVIVFRDIRITDLKSILEFIYYGQVAVLESEMDSLVKSAEKLGVHGLGKIDPQMIEEANRDDEGKKSPEKPNEEVQQAVKNGTIEKESNKKVKGGTDTANHSSPGSLNESGEKRSVHRIKSSLKKTSKISKEISKQPSSNNGDSHCSLPGGSQTPKRSSQRISEKRKGGDEFEEQFECISSPQVTEKTKKKKRRLANPNGEKKTSTPEPIDLEDSEDEPMSIVHSELDMQMIDRSSLPNFISEEEYAESNGGEQTASTVNSAPEPMPAARISIRKKTPLELPWKSQPTRLSSRKALMEDSSDLSDTEDSRTDTIFSSVKSPVTFRRKSSSVSLLSSPSAEALRMRKEKTHSGASSDSVISSPRMSSLLSARKKRKN